MSMIGEIVLSALFLILGVSYTFWGYRSLRRLLTLGAALICFAGVFYLTMDMGIVPSLVISTVAAVLAGIVSHFFFIFALFFLGAGFGALLAYAITSALPFGGNIFKIIIIVLLAAAFGVLALKTRRVYISFITSYLGAAGVCTSAGFIICAIATGFKTAAAATALLKRYSIVVSIAIVILGLIGFIIQLALTAPRKK